MTTQYASYEETVTVKTYTYTATVVTEQGETTATLTARQGPDRHQYREIACPKCHCFMPMRRYMGTWLPVHCTGCVIGLYDIQPAPAITETSEPAAPVVAEPQTVASIEASEVACEAEPGPVEEPIALRPVRPEQKAYFVAWAPSMTDDKKRYGLLCRKSDGLAVDCSCGDRVHRGRKQGRCCKHMRAHNAMLAPATTKSQQKAA